MGSASERKATDATQVYLQLRRDIVTGVLKPAEKLQIRLIAERYRTGVNPVREALNRLSSESFVDRRDRRGFFVPTISLEDLRDLVKTRCWLEGKAIEESIAHHSESWEERIVLAFHRLAKETAALLQSTSTCVGKPKWEELHREFHVALISHCGSSWLVKFCEDLMDHARRYRSLSDVLDYLERDVVQEHRELMEAVIGRDARLALRRLTDHYDLTLRIIERGIEQPDLQAGEQSAQ